MDNHVRWRSLSDPLPVVAPGAIGCSVPPGSAAIGLQISYPRCQKPNHKTLVGQNAM
jgi:hypothetical protein